MDADFLPAAWATNATGFEPAPDECARLNQIPSRPWRATRYVPTAVGGKDGQATLKIPGNGEGASLLAHNPDMIAGFGHVALHRTLREIAVETFTLDSACDRFGLDAPDYLKIDVEGAELDILQAAPRALGNCAAVKVEVSVLEQRRHQPLMQDVLTHMVEAGFVLGEIRGIHAWRRRPLPAHPYSANWIVPYSRGVAAQCDLVFLRDPASLATEAALRRLVCVAAVLGFFDHGVTALRQSAALEQHLNEQVKGSFLGELGAISRQIGRAVAISEMKSRLRTLVPLAKSLIHGTSQSGPTVPGY
jgi:FkbM family methyltransferase